MVRVVGRNVAQLPVTPSEVREPSFATQSTSVADLVTKATTAVRASAAAKPAPVGDDVVLAIPSITLGALETARQVNIPLPLNPADGRTYVSASVVGSYLPTTGGQPVPIADVSLDLRRGTLSFWQRPGEGTYTFDVMVTDGADVRSARFDVTCAHQNGRPTIEVQPDYVVELGDGPVSVPVKIGDPETPASELVKTVDLRFVSVDGQAQVVAGHITPEGDKLVFTPPGAGLVDATLVVVDAQGDSTTHRTRIFVDPKNTAPTVAFASAEKTLALGAAPVVLPVTIDDANPRQRAKLTIDWSGSLRGADGKESPFVPEVVGDNSGVRFDPSAVGEYRIRAKATDPAGLSTEAEMVVRVLDDVRPALANKPVWRLLDEGHGAVSIPLQLSDPDSKLEELTVKLEGASLRYWKPGEPAREYPHQMSYAKVEQRDDRWYLTFHVWPGVSGDYAADLSVRDTNDNLSRAQLQLFVRAENQPPKVIVPESRTWKAGSPARRLPLRVEDADMGAAKLEIKGAFTPAGDKDSKPFDVRLDVDGHILFDPAGAESKLGTYSVDVRVTDAFGVPGHGSFEIKVAEDPQAPQINLPEVVRIDATLETTVVPVPVKLHDTDTPVDQLRVEAEGEVTYKERGGATVKRELYLDIERTADGVNLLVPVRPGIDSDTAIRLRVYDGSNQMIEASTRVEARVPSLAPVVKLGPDRDIVVQQEPLRLPVELYDPNADSLVVNVKGTLVPAAGVERAVDGMRLLNEGGAHYLEFVPNAAGTYTFEVSASEAKEGGATSSAVLKVQARPSDEQYLQTFLWGRRRENEYSSGGEVAMAALPGVPKNATELRANNIYVRGLQPFVAGKKPRDQHTTATENHDSFDQAMMFSGFAMLRSTFEARNTGMTWAELVAAKSKKKELVAHANGIKDVNAFYMPTTEEIKTGTSNGKWDLAADADVVVHEAGHYVLDHLAPDLNYSGDSGALHEGYGDAQAAFIFLDPELSEDFGKVKKLEPGAGLRDSNNKATRGNTSSEVHDRGKVYAGFLWELGEHLHERIVGKARERGRDKEPLDRTAADQALSILWTFPLHLGTRSPKPGDIVRAVKKAVDSLAAAGKLDKRVDVAALHKFIDAEAARRELPRTEPTQIHQLPSTARTFEDAIEEGKRLAGFGSAPFGHMLVHEARGPSGEEVRRYQIIARVDMDGRKVLAPVEDDYLTVVRWPDGRLEVQVGTLPNIPSPPEAPIGMPLPIIPLTRGDQAAQIPPGCLSRVLGGLRAHASVELPVLSRGVDDPSRPHQRLGHDPHAGHDHPDMKPVLAQHALEQLNFGTAKDHLVFRNGKLMARLDLETISYYGPVTPAGDLGEPFYVQTAMT